MTSRYWVDFGQQRHRTTPIPKCLSANATRTNTQVMRSNVLVERRNKHEGRPDGTIVFRFSSLITGKKICCRNREPRLLTVTRRRRRRRRRGEVAASLAGEAHRRAPLTFERAQPRLRMHDVVAGDRDHALAL